LEHIFGIFKKIIKKKMKIFFNARISIQHSSFLRMACIRCKVSLNPPVPKTRSICNTCCGKPVVEGERPCACNFCDRCIGHPDVIKAVGFHPRMIGGILAAGGKITTSAAPVPPK
jgi:PHP family Zn ribbon phosphoesterase